MFHTTLKSWVAVWFLFLLVAAFTLAGCGGSQPAPTQSNVPTATQPEEPTATRPAPPTLTEAATATEEATATTAPSALPQTTAESPDAGEPEEVAYTLPMKGTGNAPVTIIEFSDYL